MGQAIGQVLPLAVGVALSRDRAKLVGESAASVHRTIERQGGNLGARVREARSTASRIDGSQDTPSREAG